MRSDLESASLAENDGLRLKSIESVHAVAEENRERYRRAGFDVTSQTGPLKSDAASGEVQSAETEGLRHLHELLAPTRARCAMAAI
jgi:hypothetical protein